MGGQSENFPHAAGESPQRYLVEPEWMNSLESSEKPSLTLGLWQSKWWSWQSCWRQSICWRIPTSAGKLQTGGESQTDPFLLNRLVHWSFIFILFIFVSFIYFILPWHVSESSQRFRTIFNVWQRRKRRTMKIRTWETIRSLFWKLCRRTLNPINM